MEAKNELANIADGAKFHLKFKRTTVYLIPRTIPSNESTIKTIAVIMNGKAWKSLAGTLLSQPSISGKATAREPLETLSVLKKPKIKVPPIAFSGLQLAKMTKAMAIHP